MEGYLNICDKVHHKMLPARPLTQAQKNELVKAARIEEENKRKARYRAKLTMFDQTKIEFEDQLKNRSTETKT